MVSPVVSWELEQNPMGWVREKALVWIGADGCRVRMPSSAAEGREMVNALIGECRGDLNRKSWRALSFPRFGAQRLLSGSSRPLLPVRVFADVCVEEILAENVVADDALPLQEMRCENWDSLRQKTRRKTRDPLQTQRETGDPR